MYNIKLNPNVNYELWITIMSQWRFTDCNKCNKVCLVKAMIFPGVMYESDSWTIKKAEHRRIDIFEL